jgi:hypothetical protein
MDDKKIINVANLDFKTLILVKVESFYTIASHVCGKYGRFAKFATL